MKPEEEAALLAPFHEKAKRGQNELFASVENVIDRLCDTINSLSAEVIKSMTGRDWILTCFIRD